METTQPLETEDLLNEFRLLVNYWNLDAEYIKDRAVRHFRKLPTNNEIPKIIDLAIANYDDNYKLHDIIILALKDYYNA